MSKNLILALIAAVALYGQSEAQTPSSAPQATVKATSGTTTIRIPAKQDILTKVLLPPATYKVEMKTGAVAITCLSLQVVSQKGRNARDEYFDAAEPINIPPHTDSTKTQNGRDNPFVLVYIKCHGGEADSQLLIMPSS